MKEGVAFSIGIVVACIGMYAGIALQLHHIGIPLTMCGGIIAGLFLADIIAK